MIMLRWWSLLRRWSFISRQQIRLRVLIRVMRWSLWRLWRLRGLTISSRATTPSNRQQIIIPRPLRPPHRRRQRLINIQRQRLLILRILIELSTLLSPYRRRVCLPCRCMYRRPRFRRIMYTRHRQRSAVVDGSAAVVWVLMMMPSMAHRLMISSCLMLGFDAPSFLRCSLDPAWVVCSWLVAINYVFIEMHLCS